jgi:hypothetical protein
MYVHVCRIVHGVCVCVGGAGTATTTSLLLLIILTKYDDKHKLFFDILVDSIASIDKTLLESLFFYFLSLERDSGSPIQPTTSTSIIVRTYRT